MPGRGRGIRAKNIEKPRPLCSSLSGPSLTSAGLLFNPARRLKDFIANNNFTHDQNEVERLNSFLMQNGKDLDSDCQDDLNALFDHFREAIRSNEVKPLIRTHLLEMLENRARGWELSEELDQYYGKQREQLGNSLHSSDVQGTKITNTKSSIKDDEKLHRPRRIKKSVSCDDRQGNNKENVVHVDFPCKSSTSEHRSSKASSVRSSRSSMDDDLIEKFQNLTSADEQRVVEGRRCSGPSPVFSFPNDSVFDDVDGPCDVKTHVCDDVKSMDYQHCEIPLPTQKPPPYSAIIEVGENSLTLSGLNENLVMGAKRVLKKSMELLKQYMEKGLPTNQEDETLGFGRFYSVRKNRSLSSPSDITMPDSKRCHLDVNHTELVLGSESLQDNKLDNVSIHHYVSSIIDELKDDGAFRFGPTSNKMEENVGDDETAFVGKCINNNNVMKMHRDSFGFLQNTNVTREAISPLSPASFIFEVQKDQSRGPFSAAMRRTNFLKTSQKYQERINEENKSPDYTRASLPSCFQKPVSPSDDGSNQHDAMNDKAISREQERIYDREFLIQLASSRLAIDPPEDWQQKVDLLRCPALLSKVREEEVFERIMRFVQWHPQDFSHHAKITGQSNTRHPSFGLHNRSISLVEGRDSSSNSKVFRSRFLSCDSTEGVSSGADSWLTSKPATGVQNVRTLNGEHLTNQETDDIIKSFDENGKSAADLETLMNGEVRDQW